MSTPVMPKSIFTFKMIREFEKIGRKEFSRSELLLFAHKVLKIASKIDNEEYWILSCEKYGPDFIEFMSKICDIDMDCYKLNLNKMKNGGKEWAERVIGAMPYSFLKGAVQVLNEEYQNDCEASL